MGPGPLPAHKSDPSDLSDLLCCQLPVMYQVVTYVIRKMAPKRSSWGAPPRLNATPLNVTIIAKIDTLQLLIQISPEKEKQKTLMELKELKLPFVMRMN